MKFLSKVKVFKMKFKFKKLLKVKFFALKMQDDTYISKWCFSSDPMINMLAEIWPHSNLLFLLIKSHQAMNSSAFFTNSSQNEVFSFHAKWQMRALINSLLKSLSVTHFSVSVGKHCKLRLCMDVTVPVVAVAAVMLWNWYRRRIRCRGFEPRMVSYLRRLHFNDRVNWSNLRMI